MRRLALMLMLIPLFLSLPAPALEARTPQVFVQLNEYFVLYSHPRPPYLADNQGVVMAPLSVFADLLGLKANFTSGGSSAYVIGPGVSLSPRMGLTASSKRAAVDGQEVILPTAPVWLEKDFDMVVPLRAVARVFGITSSWNPSFRTLSLQHAKLARNDAVELFEERLLHTSPTRDTQSFVPASFSLRRVEVDGTLRYRVEVSLKPVSAAAKGRPTMYTLAVYQDGISSFGGWRIHTSTDTGSTKDPCIRQSDATRCVEFFVVGGAPLRYILMRIRVFP